jgi:hypothetical protein
MTDQFTGRAIDVDPFEIIKLAAGWIENLPADHDTNEDALTVEYRSRPNLLAVRDAANFELPGRE